MIWLKSIRYKTYHALLAYLDFKGKALKWVWNKINELTIHHKESSKALERKKEKNRSFRYVCALSWHNIKQTENKI
jgi:hypothetical protein